MIRCKCTHKSIDHRRYFSANGKYGPCNLPGCTCCIYKRQITPPNKRKTITGLRGKMLGVS